MEVSPTPSAGTGPGMDAIPIRFSLWEMEVYHIKREMRNIRASR